MPEPMGVPRATSGTISGMIADFNKQMQALSTSSPTEEFNRSFRESMQSSTRRTPSGPPHHKQQQASSSVTHAKQGSQSYLKPDPVSIEKVVSPVIEHTLQQQQLLLQQQQALIELQKDQQQIQRALQDQLKLQTLQTQMQIEQQNKVQAVPQAPAKKADVVTIGTSMSIPSTPKVENRDWHSERQPNREVRSPDRRERREMSDRPTRDERRRQEEPSPRKSDYRDRVSVQKDASRRRDDSRSPDWDRDRVRERRKERPANKKDRRRLPQPTVEEIQGAVDAISNSLPISSASRCRETSPRFNSSKSPSGVMLRHQSAVMSSSPPIITGSVQGSSIAVLDGRSMSPGLLIASYPVQVVSPITRSYSPPVSSLNQA